MRSPLVPLLFALLALPLCAESGRRQLGVPYLAPADLASADAYRAEKAKLDVFTPADATGLPIVIWFHAGGLSQGEKFIPGELVGKNLVVVAPGYRLLPRATVADAVEDAAEAVAWTFRHAEEIGGDPSKIFISGASAGGYLASLVTLDRSYLKRRGLDANRVAGLIPFSGQMITHFALRETRGLRREQPLVDEFAPLYHVRGDAPPILLITGDRELELLGRYEENAYMARMLKIAGHTSVRLIEIPGKDHAGMTPPAFPFLLEEVTRVLDGRLSSRVATGAQADGGR
jgi:acetyl esterase/lipase